MQAPPKSPAKLTPKSPAKSKLALKLTPPASPLPAPAAAQQRSGATLPFKVGRCLLVRTSCIAAAAPTAITAAGGGLEFNVSATPPATQGNTIDSLENKRSALLEKRMAILEERLATEGARAAALEVRAAASEERAAASEERATALEERVVALEKRLAQIELLPRK